MSDLELYVKKGSRDGAPSISFSPKGLIGLSAACMEAYFKGKDYAQLYFGRKGVVGIKPCAKGSPQGFKLIKTKVRPTAHIYARSFFADNKIDHSVTRRFYPEWDKAGEMILISLKDGVDV